MSDKNLLQAILDKIHSVGVKVDKGFGEMGEEIRENRKRIGRLGLQLADLEDDAPTIEEVDGLEKRVSKLEHQVVKN